MADKPASSSAASALPWILTPALVGALVGYGTQADIAPEILTAVGGAALLGLLGAGVAQLAALKSRLGTTLGGREDESRQLADAFRSSMEDVMKQTHDQLAKVQASLAASAKALDDGLGKNRDAFQASMDSLGKQLQFQSTEWGDELAKIFNEHSSMQQSGVDALVQVTRDWEESVAGTLRDHAQSMKTLTEHLSGDQLTKSLEKAAGNLAEKVESVQKLAVNVDEMLKVSQATDSTLKTLSSAEDFRNTLQTFQEHLAESQRLLKEATKPRQFQLTESFGE